MPIQTVHLHGHRILAKPNPYKPGTFVAYTFVGRAQAQRWVERLGTDWTIYPLHRPFLVRRRQPPSPRSRRTCCACTPARWELTTSVRCPILGRKVDP
jgi:hypothetical protein